MTVAQTPSHIVSTVVWTLASIALVYALTLAFCVLTGRAVPETLAAHFANLGNTAMGAIIGMLVNTRSNPPVTSSETVSTTTERTDPPAEPPTAPTNP